ncbi:SUKH-4 family immunity protein [Streptomyces sp. NPDC057638]|uniref:SUKH-4 family immunity protein n=1 Tax=Streptomyces sp. NPDC057638 TaxID=3346190 RepID=UPI0036B82D13
MVTFAQAQERAEEWVNGDVPLYQQREVRVREFGLGFVVWAEDREDGGRTGGGRQRMVIARDSGEATLWPALPVGEVIRRYEEEYGARIDPGAMGGAGSPPKRIDLHQTSFLLSPPQWLQDEADRQGAADAAEKPEPGPEPEAGTAPGSASGPELGSASETEPGPEAEPESGPGPGPGPGAEPESGRGSGTGPESETAAVPVEAPGSPGSPGSLDTRGTHGAPGSDASADCADCADSGEVGGGTDTSSTAVTLPAAPRVPEPPTVTVPAPRADSGAEPEMKPEPEPEMKPEAAIPSAGSTEPGAPPPSPTLIVPTPSTGAEDITVVVDGAATGPAPLPPGEDGDESGAVSTTGSEAGGGEAVTVVGSVFPTPAAGVPVPPPAAEPVAPTIVDVPPGPPAPTVSPGGASDAPTVAAGQAVASAVPAGASAPSAGLPDVSAVSGGASDAPTVAAGQAVASAVPAGASAPSAGLPAASAAPVSAPDVSTPPVGASGASTPPAGQAVAAAAPGGASDAPTPPPPAPVAPPTPPPPVGRPGVPLPPLARPGEAPGVNPQTPQTPQTPRTPPPPPTVAPGYMPTRLSPPVPAAPPTPPSGVHRAATVVGGPPPGGGVSPVVPPPPGPPGPPGAPFSVPGPPPFSVPGPASAYGYPRHHHGVPTVGPGYQAVLRYRAHDGTEAQIIRRSAPGTPHPEWQILHELRALNVPPGQVLELHTELESCRVAGGYCARMIRESWPQARITHIAPYGTDHSGRQDGMRQLLTHQGELHQVADGPARPAPVRAPLPRVVPAPPAAPQQVAHELVAAFGPQAVYRFDQRAVSRQGVPELVAATLVWAGLPGDFNPFFWVQPAQPVVPTLAELAAQRQVPTALDASSYLVIGSDFGRAVCVQYGTAHIVAVPVEATPGTRSAVPQFVNSGLPEFVRCLALLGRMWRLRYGLNPEQAGRWTVDFQEQLAALDPRALSSPENWWAVLLEQMWDGLL